jgi:hypothetical protein
MTTGQEFYLAMVVVAFCLFGLVLAIVSWTEGRPAKVHVAHPPTAAKPAPRGSHPLAVRAAA